MHESGGIEWYGLLRVRVRVHIESWQNVFRVRGGRTRVRNRRDRVGSPWEAAADGCVVPFVCAETAFSLAVAGRGGDVVFLPADSGYHGGHAATPPHAYVETALRSAPQTPQPVLNDGLDRMIKRMFDVFASTVALVLLSPLLLLTAGAVRLSSPGPVFYLQRRIGLHMEPFHMIKFRTMVEGADRVGPHVTRGNDPRITPIGAFLRKTKLDELPELWNVVRGDMSLVGPRPEAPRYVDLYSEDARALFAVRPGVTDLATLLFRDEESVLAGAEDHERAYVDVVLPVKLKLAAQYARRQSFLLDVSILYHTARAVLFGKLGRYRLHPIAARAWDRVNAEYGACS